MNKIDTKLYDVCVVGAGFSGLVFAIKVARAGLLVCLVDQNNTVGRRILSTGNGRCNFTNSKMGEDYYYSNSDLSFITDNHQDLIDFLGELGVVHKNLDGFYYPITNQARTVKEALELEINRLGIDVFLSCTVKDIGKADIFSISSNDLVIKAQNVVIATGGMAAPTLGTSKLGYKTASKFKLKVTELAPALVGFSSKDNRLKTLAGVRAQGCVNYRGHSCTGEIQFNKDGISGYPVMCISRFVGFDELHGGLDNVYIDFIPYLSRDDLKVEFVRRFKRVPDDMIADSLKGLTSNHIISNVLQEARIYSDTIVSKLDEEDMEYLLDAFKNYALSIDGTKGFNNAQVTAGGVSLDCLSENMESKNIQGLFFVGEVVDVDGICGGYNLQWAFTSASLAADLIIGESK